MKRASALVIAAFFMILILTSCGSGAKETDVPVNNNIRITQYVAGDFRNKTAEAEKWVSENLESFNAELCTRTASDILTIGETTYVSFFSFESNGLGEEYTCQLEKYVDGKRSILADAIDVGPYGDFPITIIRDGDNTLLSVFGDQLIDVATWGDSGRIIVTCSEGNTEIIDYSFTDEKVTEEMKAGREYRGFRCELIHKLESSDIASIVFVSTIKDRHTGITTRLFELDDDLRIISARVVNDDGSYDEGINAYCYSDFDHIYPELFE